MKSNWKFTTLLLAVLLLAACAQAGLPPATPTPDPQPTDGPLEPAYPDPNEPVAGPGEDDPGAGPGYAPQPGDDLLERGSVFVEEFGILTLESFPPQFVLHLTGNMPTPCHELRAVVSGPGKTGTIDVELYSLSDPMKLCIQVLAPFEANIALGSYSAESGEISYPVTINGEQVVGEIKP